MDYKVSEVELTYKNRTPYRERKKVKDSQTAYTLLSEQFPNMDYRESFKVLYLNSAHQVLACTTISEGGITQTVADIRIILQGALLTNATAMIIAHNHPSGEALPSREDKELTTRIAEASKLLNMKLLDHLIITSDGYYSFVDNGMF